jgi:hypothetical protein
MSFSQMLLSQDDIQPTPLGEVKDGITLIKTKRTRRPLDARIELTDDELQV